MRFRRFGSGIWPCADSHEFHKHLTLWRTQFDNSGVTKVSSVEHYKRFRRLGRVLYNLRLTAGKTTCLKVHVIPEPPEQSISHFRIGKAGQT